MQQLVMQLKENIKFVTFQQFFALIITLYQRYSLRRAALE